MRRAPLPWTPLNSAADNGHVEVVKILLEKGADLTIANDDGWTPLHAASSNGHLHVVRLLLDELTSLAQSSIEKKGVNQKDFLHRTPLHVAVYSGHEAIIKVLLEFGSDSSINDCYGRSALDWASINKPLFQKLGDWRGKLRPNRVAEQSRVLRQTLRDLSKELIHSARDDYFHELGHCLIHLGDLHAASTAFEQHIAFNEQEKVTTHNAYCSFCTTPNSIKGDRFVCKVCP